MAMNSLKDLYLHEAKDLAFAENLGKKFQQDALEKTSSDSLKSLIEKAHDIASKNAETAKEIIESHGESGTEECEAMQGIVKEGRGHFDHDMTDDVMDAAIISSLQRVQHYRLAGYGCLRAWAKQLGLESDELKWQHMLDTATALDNELTEIAVKSVNNAAA